MEFTEYLNEEMTITWLQQTYDHLNNLLFANKLERYPIFLKPLKGIGAQTISMQRRMGRRVISSRVERLEFSNRMQRSDDVLRGIMAHEMIHVWIQQNVISDSGPHGTHFMNKLFEIQKLAPFKIPLKDTVEDALDPKVVVAQYRIVVFYKGNTAMTVFKETVDVQSLKNKLLIYPQIIPVICVKTKHIELERYTVKTKIPSYGWSGLRLDNPNFAGECIAKGQILFTITQTTPRP